METSGRRRSMRASGSRSKSAFEPSAHPQRRCPTLSHMPAASGTTKRCADWAFVSGVSPVSPNLKLIDRIQSGIGIGGISRHQALYAETGGTSATVTRFSGETTGLRHTWDSWDTPKRGHGARSATFKPCDYFVVPVARRKHDLATRAAKPKN